MTRYFFTGGTMPSLDLFLYFQQHLAAESVSYVNGVHYSRTLEQWLQKQDRTEKALLPLFKVRPTASRLWSACEVHIVNKSFTPEKEVTGEIPKAQSCIAL